MTALRVWGAVTLIYSGVYRDIMVYQDEFVATNGLQCGAVVNVTCFNQSGCSFQF